MPIVPQKKPCPGQAGLRQFDRTQLTGMTGVTVDADLPAGIMLFFSMYPFFFANAVLSVPVSLTGPPFLPMHCCEWISNNRNSHLFAIQTTINATPFWKLFLLRPTLVGPASWLDLAGCSGSPVPFFYQHLLCSQLGSRSQINGSSHWFVCYFLFGKVAPVSLVSNNAVFFCRFTHNHLRDGLPQQRTSG